MWRSEPLDHPLAGDSGSHKPLMYVLGTKLWSYARAVDALTAEAAL